MSVMPDNFAVSHEKLGARCHLVIVKGELDLFTAPAFKDVTEKTLETPGAQIVIDLSEVTFLDSTALGVLISTLRAARDHGGDLALICTDPKVLATFSITGLDRVFTITEDRAGALTLLGQSLSSS